jgi:hypothetical protein
LGKGSEFLLDTLIPIEDRGVVTTAKKLADLG